MINETNNTSKLYLDLQQIDPLIKQLDSSFNNIDKSIIEIINEYNKMDKTIWNSKEKLALDEILNDYFDKINNFGKEGITNTETLNNYIKTFKDVHSDINKSVGDTNV